MTRSSSKWLNWAVGLAGAVALLLATTLRAEPLDLPAIKEKGVIRIALYKEYPPYSDQNRGIDLDIAAAIARKLQVKLDPVWFKADENVEGDLRNMVWKGHYLGTGPADAMIHAPIDPAFAARNPQVRFVAPYFRDRLEIARDLAKVPQADDFWFLKDNYIGVEGTSLASVVMLSHEGGNYRDRIKFYHDASEAIAALKKGEVAAVMAPHGEAQGLLAGQSGYAVGPVPIPGGLAARQWVLGMAVKSAHAALAEALETAMSELAAEGDLEKIFMRYGVGYLKP